MYENIDLEPLDYFVTREISAEWIAQTDNKEGGRRFDERIITNFDNILQLFYEKKYKEGLETFVDIITTYGYPLRVDDIEMICDYIEKFGIDKSKETLMRDSYDVPKQNKPE